MKKCFLQNVIMNLLLQSMGVKETFFGYEEDTRSVDSENSFSSLSHSTFSDEDVLDEVVSVSCLSSAFFSSAVISVHELPSEIGVSPHVLDISVKQAGEVNDILSPFPLFCVVQCYTLFCG